MSVRLVDIIEVGHETVTRLDFESRKRDVSSALRNVRAYSEQVTRLYSAGLKCSVLIEHIFPQFVSRIDAQDTLTIYLAFNVRNQGIMKTAMAYISHDA